MQPGTLTVRSSIFLSSLFSCTSLFGFQVFVGTLYRFDLSEA